MGNWLKRGETAAGTASGTEASTVDTGDGADGGVQDGDFQWGFIFTDAAGASLSIDEDGAPWNEQYVDAGPNTAKMVWKIALDEPAGGYTVRQGGAADGLGFILGNFDPNGDVIEFASLVKDMHDAGSTADPVTPTIVAPGPGAGCLSVLALSNDTHWAENTAPSGYTPLQRLDNVSTPAVGFQSVAPHFDLSIAAGSYDETNNWAGVDDIVAGILAIHRSAGGGEGYGLLFSAPFALGDGSKGGEGSGDLLGAGSALAYGEKGGESSALVIDAGSVEALGVKGGEASGLTMSHGVWLGFGEKGGEASALLYDSPDVLVYGQKGALAGTGWGLVGEVAEMIAHGQKGGEGAGLVPGTPVVVVHGLKASDGFAQVFDAGVLQALGEKAAAGYPLVLEVGSVLAGSVVFIVLYPIASMTGPALHEPMIGDALRELLIGPATSEPMIGNEHKD